MYRNKTSSTKLTKLFDSHIVNPRHKDDDINNKQEAGKNLTFKRIVRAKLRIT